MLAASTSRFASTPLSPNQLPDRNLDRLGLAVPISTLSVPSEGAQISTVLIPSLVGAVVSSIKNRLFFHFETRSNHTNRINGSVVPYSAGITNFSCPTCLRLLLLVLFAALQRTRDATFAKPPITVRRSAREKTGLCTSCFADRIGLSSQHVRSRKQ